MITSDSRSISWWYLWSICNVWQGDSTSFAMVCIEFKYSLHEDICFSKKEIINSMSKPSNDIILKLLIKGLSKACYLLYQSQWPMIRVKHSNFFLMPVKILYDDESKCSSKNMLRVHMNDQSYVLEQNEKKRSMAL